MRGFTYLFTPDVFSLGAEGNASYDLWDGRVCARALSTDRRRVLVTTPVRAYLNVDTALDADDLVQRLQADPLHANDCVLSGTFEEPFPGLEVTRVE